MTILFRNKLLHKLVLPGVLNKGAFLGNAFNLFPQEGIYLWDEIAEEPEDFEDIDCLESIESECCEGAVIPEALNDYVFETTEGIDILPVDKVILPNLIFNDGYGCLSGTTLTAIDGSFLQDGRHSVEVQIRNCGAVIATKESFFNIDTECPEIEITSPVDGNEIAEIPTLDYTVVDATGVQRVEVFIDGESYGHLPSGTELDFLDFGQHSILITAEDIATKGKMAYRGLSGYGYGYGDGYDGYGDIFGPGENQGNTCSILISFTLCRPICLDISENTKLASGDEIGKYVYIGSDATGEQQADAAFEELRILNKASTEDDLLNDFRLLKETVRYQNREAGGPLLDDALKLELLEKDIDCERISIQTETLLLAHFDNNLELAKGIDNTNATFTDENGIATILDGPDLSRSKQFIIERRAAANDIDVTVFFPEGEEIDKELLTDSIKRVIPAHAQVFIEYVPQEATQPACKESS